MTRADRGAGWTGVRVSERTVERRWRAGPSYRLSRERGRPGCGGRPSGLAQQREERGRLPGSVELGFSAGFGFGFPIGFLFLNQTKFEFQIQI